jgi:anthranilate phosphoribosyltransferase
MDFAAFIREIGRGASGARDLSRAEAQELYGAMLDGEVPDLELGAIVIALRVKTETVDEMVGFLAAANARLHTLRRPHGKVRPVVIPSYNGARRSANLTPLLALLLQRFGVPVLVHGLGEAGSDFGRVTSEQIFRAGHPAEQQPGTGATGRRCPRSGLPALAGPFSRSRPAARPAPSSRPAQQRAQPRQDA